MNDRSCWNCGHAQESHTFEGGCSVKLEGGRCECLMYEDSEYYGQQRKRDTYRLSDMRRLGQRREWR